MRSLPNSVIFIIALFLSLASVLLIFKFIQDQKRKGVVPGRVVVAKQDIAPQQLLNVDMIDIKMLPMAEVPPNSLNSLENAVGKVARVGIKQGEVISAKDVLSESENLIGFLPVNFRAMTIVVRQNPGEGNLYRLGQMVDILVTLKDGSRLATRTLLQNVRILYKNPTKLDMDKGPQDVSYTFAVSPRDAEKLALAQKEGNIQIVVRSQNDTQTVSTAGTTSDQVFGHAGASFLRGINENAQDQGESTEGPTMEIIRGTEIEEKTFKQPEMPAYQYNEFGEAGENAGAEATPNSETGATDNAESETPQPEAVQ